MPIQSSFSSPHNHTQRDTLPCCDNPLGVVTFISPNLIPSTVPLTHSHPTAAVQSGMAQFGTSKLSSRQPHISEHHIQIHTSPCIHVNTVFQISLFQCAFWFIKFYSHQLMHFVIQLYISLLSYIKITSNTLGSTPTCFDLLWDHLQGVLYLLPCRCCWY